MPIAALKHSLRRVWPGTLKLRMVLMVMLAVLPLVASRLWTLQGESTRILQKAQQQAIEMARSGVANSLDVIDEARASLEILAQLRGVISDNVAVCDDTLSELARARPWAAGLFVLDINGIVTCSSNPETVGLDISNRAYVKTALATREFFAGDFIIAKKSRQPLIGSALPVYDHAGGLKRVLVATISARWFDRIAAGIVSGNPGSTVTLLDGTGVVIADAPAGGNVVGEPLVSESMRTALMAPGVEHFEAKGDDDNQRIFGAAKMNHTHARLLVGLSRKTIMEDMALRQRNATIELVLLCLVMGTSMWLFGDHALARPIQELLNHARHVGRGRLDTRVKGKRWPREMAILARSFNLMTARLEQHDARQEASKALLLKQSLTDPLTDIPNRRAFDQQLAEVWAAAEANGEPIAIAMIDADHFKAYNDTYGHGAGDTALITIGNVLMRIAHAAGGYAARLGGEEFAVLLPGHDEIDALAVGDQICAMAREYALPHEGSKMGIVTVSVGVASAVPERDLRSRMLLGAADSALYAAKASGRNRAMGISRLHALARSMPPGTAPSAAATGSALTG